MPKRKNKTTRARTKATTTGGAATGRLKVTNPSGYTAAHNRGKSLQFVSGTRERTTGTLQLGGLYTEANEYLDVFMLTPLDFIGTRLAPAFQTHQYWTPKKLVFEFVPSVAVTQAGRVAAAPITDPSNTPAASFGNFTLMNFQGCAEAPIAKGCRWELPVCPTKRFYCNEDGSNLRFTTPGLLAILVSGTGLATNTQVGAMLLHYDIVFEVACLNLQPTKDTSYDRWNVGAALAGLYLSSGIADAAAGEGVGIQTAVPGAHTKSNNQVTAGRLDRARTNTLNASVCGSSLPRGSWIFSRSAAVEYDDAGDTMTDVVSSSWLGMAWAGLMGRFVRLLSSAAGNLFFSMVYDLDSTP